MEALTLTADKGSELPSTNLLLNGSYPICKF